MEKFENQLNSIIADLYNWVPKVEERALRTAFGSLVTAAEARILDVIGQRSEKMTISEVAAALQITVPTITIALKKLVDKGFVTKTACIADGRRFLVSLTQQGENICETHSRFKEKLAEAATAGLSDDEKDILLSCVKKLSEFFVTPSSVNGT